MTEEQRAASLLDRLGATWGAWFVGSLRDYPRAAVAILSRNGPARTLIASGIFWAFAIGGAVTGLFTPDASLVWSSLLLVPFAILLSIGATGQARTSGLLEYDGWRPLRAATSALGDQAERSPRAATALAYILGISVMLVGLAAVGIAIARVFS